MSNKTNILFPIEIANRELDFRLFLAAYCARPNNRIFIGESNAIYRVVQNTRGGIYAGKNIFMRLFPGPVQQLERYEMLKNRGFKLVHLDEEGGVMAGDEERWKDWLNKKLDVNCLKPDDHVCTWGKWQEEYYRSLNPACKDNIQTTGHPRFDLYKPTHRGFYDFDVTKLKERFGDFVLVNTNFAWSNHHKGVMGLGGAFSGRWNYNRDDEKKRLDHVGQWAHTWHITVEFVKLVTRLSIEIPHLNYVIRPHPSENTAFYKTIFNGVPNVHIVHEGSVGPWLLAAKALIHDGCTTAIESHFCSTPVINYKSVRDERYDLILPNIFGTKCSSEDEVITELQRVLKEGLREEKELPDITAQLFDNFRHDCFSQYSDAILHVAETVSSEGSADDFKMRAQTAYWRIFQRDKDRRAERWEGGLAKWHGFADIDLDRKMQTIQRILNKEVRYTVQSERLMTVEC